MAEMTGHVIKVRWASPDSGFAILVIATEKGSEIAVGEMLAGIVPGHEVKFKGEWIEHSKFGSQFKVSSAQADLPRTAEGAMKWFTNIPGCGSTVAGRIVERFGADCVSLITMNRDVLLEIEGMTEDKADSIGKVCRSRASTAEVEIWLQGLGFGEKTTKAIVTRFKSETREVIEANPYLLTKVKGIGFKTADQAAIKLGIPMNSPLRVKAGIHHCLSEEISKGNTFMAQAQLASKACGLLRVNRETFDDNLAELEESQEIVIDGEAVYEKALHHMEFQVACDLINLLQSREVETKAVLHRRHVDGFELDEAQKMALENVVTQKVAIITGGPGTGKTTMVKQILDSFRGLRVTLCAPTGRAAKRLSLATGRPAATIHRALEYHPELGWRRNRDNLLDTDLLICDEASMVDTMLAFRLLAAIPSGARLIFVGDMDQLPSVGPGKILEDMISSGVLPVSYLTTIHRQANRRSMIVEGTRAEVRGGLEQRRRRPRKSTTAPHRPASTHQGTRPKDPQRIRWKKEEVLTQGRARTEASLQRLPPRQQEIELVQSPDHSDDHQHRPHDG